MASLSNLKYRIFCLVKKNIIAKIQIIGMILAVAFNFLKVGSGFHGIHLSPDVILKFEIQTDYIIFKLFKSVDIYLK